MFANESLPSSDGARSKRIRDLILYKLLFRQLRELRHLLTQQLDSELSSHARHIRVTDFILASDPVLVAEPVHLVGVTEAGLQH